MTFQMYLSPAPNGKLLVPLLLRISFVQQPLILHILPNKGKLFGMREMTWGHSEEKPMVPV